MADTINLTARDTKKTIVEIDLGAIAHNLKIIKAKVGADKKILLPVKADGYGHGAVQVSKIAEENGLADILGVSSPEEGMELREAGIELPVLILGLILPCKDNIDNIIDYNLSQTVADIELALKISERAIEKEKRVRLHLKVDTGMGRIGCGPEESAELARRISGLNGVLLEGIFSHFPVADDPDSDFTRRQINEFEAVIREIEERSIEIPLKHLANSAAIFQYSDSIFNLVRPGIAAYGYSPSPDFNSGIDLIPSMTFKSYIVFNKRVKKGTPLSYGLTYTADKDSNIATVPVGYGDGYNRQLSNRGRVIIRDRRYPVAGRVCMDQIMVNLGDDEYPAGEEVILFGREGVTVETIAQLTNTIPYEVTCAISKRVRRIYK